MADDAESLDDLLATPAPMGDDVVEDEEAPDDEGDEFDMHAQEALGEGATPEQVDALRMAILSLQRGL